MWWEFIGPDSAPGRECSIEGEKFKDTRENGTDVDYANQIPCEVAKMIRGPREGSKDEEADQERRRRHNRSYAQEGNQKGKMGEVLTRLALFSFLESGLTV